MTTPTRNRRAEILAAAAGLFAERGFHGVSIEEIGAAVGVSGPALYRHFRGKEALLTEILLDISGRLSSAGESAAALDPAEALDVLLRGHIEFALGHPELIRVHERELHNVPTADQRAIRRLQRRYVEEWVGVVRDLYPGCAVARVRAAVHAVFGLLNSTPRSVGELGREEMASVLEVMARASLRVAVSHD